MRPGCGTRSFPRPGGRWTAHCGFWRSPADPGVARVVSMERGIRQARRTVLVLSPAYLADNMAEFENVLAQTLGIQEGTYRVLPVKMAPVDDAQLPTRLSMLTTLDLAHSQPRRA